MHAIRRQAHRVAATHAAGTNYNPFSRVRSREQAISIAEQEPQRSHSEGQIQLTNEEERRLEKIETCMEFDVATSKKGSNDTSDKTSVGGSPEPKTSQDGAINAESSHFVHNVRPTERRRATFSSLPTIESRAWTKRIVRGAPDEVNPEGDGYEAERLDVEERRRRALKRRIPIGQQIRFVLFDSWTNILLPFVPVGFALNYARVDSIAVFCVNFLAIIPSATILSAATNEISSRNGDKVGALLNISFGNAVQLIMSILLLKSHQVQILRFSLIGSILSNLLLTSGSSFLLGGIYDGRMEQYFSATTAQTVSMMLLLAVTSLVIPTAAHLMADTPPQGIVSQSRGTSIVIIVSYILWLVFQLRTHREAFMEPPKKAKARERVEDVNLARGIAAIGAGTAAASGGAANVERHLSLSKRAETEDSECDIQEPNLTLPVAIIVLIISVVLIAFNTEFTTNSIQSLLQHVSRTFLGMIVLPLLSVDTMAVSVAIRDKMDMSIALTLERCMQTSLFVLPSAVLLAWIMGIDGMTLEFQGFSIAALFASIIIVTYVVQEGKSNWLTGALLIKVFIIVSLAAFYIED